ncbi:hypothetical protein ACG3SL_10735 [Sphingomonas sp. CJ20]
MIGNSSKPLASLSSGLLARKGHARPAMRPQGFVGLGTGAAPDDLGWNDMGEDTPVVQQTRPVVLRQRDALGARIAEPVAAPEPVVEAAPAVEPAPVVAAAPVVKIALPVRAVSPKKARAAFTLRLDPDRHLRLRLASALTHRSAQLLVTEALDAFLETLPEVEALARRVADGGERG